MFFRGLLVAGLLLAIDSRALGDGFRCPRTEKLIAVGNSMSKVVAKCGEPTSREDVTETECSSHGHCWTVKTGERWLYRFGLYDLSKILFFAGGRLAKIDDGDYGH
jgi:hypothetical protein